MPEILGFQYLKKSDSPKIPILGKNAVHPFHEAGLRTLGFMLNSKENFVHLRKLSIGSVCRDENTKDSFLYETHIDDLQEILIGLFKKCPMLSDLEIETFCDGKNLLNHWKFCTPIVVS